MTSVVNSESNDNAGQPTQPAPDDHLVAQETGSLDTPASARRAPSERRPLSDVNHLAHADQQERATVMARGGAREAILRARERHRQRNAIPTRDDEAPPLQGRTAAEQDDVVSSTTPVAPDDAGVQQRDETPPPPPQDRVLDTRLRQASPGTIDPFRRSYNDPKPPVPASELPAGAEALSTRDGERTRFDSVPELRPDIVLPRRQPPISPVRRRAEAARQRLRAQDAVAPDEPAAKPSGSNARLYGRVAGTANQSGKSGRASSPSQSRKPSQADQSRTIRAAARAVRDNYPNRQVARLSFQRRSEADDSIGGTSPVPSVDDLATRDPDMIEDGQRSLSPSGANDTTMQSADREPPIASEAPQLPSIEQLAPSEPSHAAIGRRAPNAFGMFNADDTASTSETLDLGDVVVDEPVTMRRRSWLTGLGRRRHNVSASSAPPAATFPLRVAAMERPRSDDAATRAVLPSESPPGQPPPGANLVSNTVPNVALDRADQRVIATSSDAGEAGSDRPVSSQRSNEASDASLTQLPVSPAPGAQRLPTALPTLADEAPALERHAESVPARTRSTSTPPRREPDPTPPPPQGEPRPKAPRPPVDTADMANLRQRLFGASDGDGRSQASAMREPHTAPAPERETALPSTAVAEGEHSGLISLEDEYPQVEAAPGFDLRNIVARHHDILDMRIKLAPEVPRICQTCRSFRPSENEERGWCTSEFAFTHRRMVNAGDRPCESSIGCWWLPNDGVWLTDTVMKAFEEPTPLMDSILNRYERRRVGER